jgi:hypothetical protein
MIEAYSGEEESPGVPSFAGLMKTLDKLINSTGYNLPDEKLQAPYKIWELARENPAKMKALVTKINARFDALRQEIATVYDGIDAELDALQEKYFSQRQGHKS